MNAPITRRALLGATAAVGAVALPIGVLAGTPDTPALDADEAFFALIERHREATEAWETACRDLEAARDRAWTAHPPRPVLLTATSSDLLNGLAPSGRSHKPGGRAWIFFNLDDFDRLRDAGPVTSHVLDDTGDSLVSVPNPTGEARRREVVAIYDRWLADRAAINDRLGLTAAEVAEEPLCAVMEAAEAAVEAYVPTTLAGVRAKAAWALARCDRADAALVLLRQLASDAAPPVTDEEADDMPVTA